MRDSVIRETENLIEEKKLRRRRGRLVTSLAALVAVGTFGVLMLTGVAMTRKDKVLDCPYEGQLLAHIHNDDCYNADGILVCPLEELELHTHDESCYETETYLVCGMEETPGHQHDESCYTWVRGELLCTDESEEHEHTDDCYDWYQELTCGMAEGDGAHWHTDACYETVSTLICDMPEITETHTHGDECFQIIETVVDEPVQVSPEFVLPEETPEPEVSEPQGDPYADVEDWTYWNAMFAGLELTGKWDDDLLAVASSQAGYTESALNYVVSGSGEHKGYTRYGAWYGVPYGDWCAMYVSFCLNYAGIPDAAVPRDANVPQWAQVLNSLLMYVPAEAPDFAPRPGDIVFIDYDRARAPYTDEEGRVIEPVTGPGDADHVGIAYYLDAERNELVVLEGNSSDRVQYVTYDLNDYYVLGVGVLPENPNYVPPVEETEAPDAEEPAEDVSEPADEESAGETAEEEPSDPTVFFSDAEEESENDIDNETEIENETQADEAGADAADEIPADGDASEEMTSDEPASDEPASDELASNELASDELASDESASDELASDELASDEPVVTFEEKVNGLLVSVEAPVGAFPEGTTMTVTPVAVEDVEQAVTEAVDTQVLHMQAVDITFRDADGNEIEPAMPIRVTMTPDEAMEAAPVVVHVDDEGAAQIVEQTAVEDLTENPAENAVVFESDTFSVYVLAQVIKKTVITADGETWEITVTYGPEAGIPDGATLEAVEIPEGSEEYESYIKQAKDALYLDDGLLIDISFARFFDISILDADGNELEPECPVYVSIRYADAVELNGNLPSIVHFADEGIEVLDVDTRLDSADARETEAVNVFEYEQSSFSVSGTIIDTVNIDTGKYFIVTEKNGRYYALTNTGSAVEVTYDPTYNEFVFSDDNVAASALWDVNRLYGTYYNITTQDGVNGLQLLGHTDTPDRLIGLPMSLSVTRSNGNQFHIREDDWNSTLVFKDNNQFGADYYQYTSEFQDIYWGPWYMGTTEVITWENCANVRFARYVVDNGAGTPPDANDEPYEGKEIDPDELNAWLEDFFDDRMIDADSCSKTAEVFDYENRIYQIDFTAQSKVRALLNNLDLAFSFDFSNSMLFPTTLTSIGNVDLTQSFLNRMVSRGQLSRDKVYFVISDVTQTATVNALYYEGGQWKYLDASKYARHQAGTAVSDTNTKTKISTAAGATDNGSYILYEAPQGYVDWIKNTSNSVFLNPYNRLSTMKGTVTRVFGYLDELAAKYKVRVRVGWNGFAGYTNRNQSGEVYDFRARPAYAAAHDLKDLETMSIADLLYAFNLVGSTDGATTGGGTRPDRAFDDAGTNMGFDPTESTAKYLILITDGAPQGGGAANAAAALSEGITEGQNLTNNHDVDIITIGLSTERVKGADDLFKAIAYDPEIGEQLKYQAADGAKLVSALEDAIMQTIQKVTVVGTIMDTIDSAFYPVSTNGRPLENNDWITLDGTLIPVWQRNPNTPHGVIGIDGDGNWTVTWQEQDIVWADSDHPYGWHGRVLVKAKEDFLGGNTIPTNEKEATIEPIRIKDPETGELHEFSDIYDEDDYSFDDMPVELDTPYINVDELYIPPQNTSWTVYLDTEVDPYTQIKELYKNISVLEVVYEDETDPSHRLVPRSGSDMGMIYELITGNTEADILLAISDNRDTNGTARNTIPLSDYLRKWTVSVEPDEIVYADDGVTPVYSTPTAQTYDHVDLQESEWTKLLSGEPVYREYSEYDHSPGLIRLTLVQNVAAGEDGLPDPHNTKVLGRVETYTLKAEYIPYAGADVERHTGGFRTSAMGIATDPITSDHVHTIDVIKKIVKIKKTDYNGTTISEAVFTVCQKTPAPTDEDPDAVDDVNVTTMSTVNGIATWDYVVPDPDQRIPGEYWQDETSWFLREETPPEGYAAYDGEIELKLAIDDEKEVLAPSNSNNAQLYNWVQTADVSVPAYDSEYVTVSQNGELMISVKNDRSVDIDVIKTDEYGNEINGAKFTLSKGSGHAKGFKVFKKGTTVEVEVANGQFTVPVGGVTITGLGPGDYTLEETEAPEGYLITIQPITFSISRTGEVVYTNENGNTTPKVTPANHNTQYTIQNVLGVELPHTGGVGTRVFTLAGLMLFSLAGAVFCGEQRRRKSSC